MRLFEIPTLVALGLAVPAAIPLAARWLRVAQREHYIPPWTTRVGFLWYRLRPANLVLLVVGLALVAVAALSAPLDPVGAPGAGSGLATFAWAGVAAVAVAASLPLGLPVRGRSSPFAFTGRVTRLLVAWVVLVAVLAVGLATLLGAGGPALVLLAAAPVTDLALAITRPIERARQRTFLESARRRLGQVRPTIVAITGSYGKTSTKNHVAQVLDGTFAVVASPASFNNLMGLSRAVNERVAPGTEVFVAEMGVYGEGEIRELSRSFPPDVAAITTIGEAHLARMGSREVILRAKSEITERASTVVLPIDEPELAALAARCRAEGKRVVTVSAGRAASPDGSPVDAGVTAAARDADVVVDADAGTVSVRTPTGRDEARVALPPAGHAVNVAVTVGIATALGVQLATIAPRLGDLRGAAHRAELRSARPDGTGAAILDDTYNANPVGASTAVRAAAELARERGGELVVVTPGMIELGAVQAERNRALAAEIVAAGGHLVVVGLTNRAALLAGAGAGAGAGPEARAEAGAEARPGAEAVGRHPAVAVATREQAVRLALATAGERGVVLYENDLPDHYP